MNYLDILKNKWQTITLITLSIVVLSLVFTLIQPFEYKSQVELLIIQKQTASLDAYAATRAGEKMALNLASVVETKSFYDKVMSGNFGISRVNLPSDENELRKVWQKKIDTQVFPETSILSVSVYDKDKRQANKIANGVAYTLVNNSAEYHGGGSDVLIKVVNEPLVSNRPARPNIVLNFVLSLIVGLVISLAWTFYAFHNALEKEVKNLDSEEYRRNRIRESFGEDEV